MSKHVNIMILLVILAAFFGQVGLALPLPIGMSPFKKQVSWLIADQNRPEIRDGYDYSHRTSVQGHVIYSVVSLIGFCMVSGMLGKLNF